MSPSEVIRFEARWPQNGPAKRQAIRHELGVAESRYYVLLHRAAHSSEGIATDPFTARRVRERAVAQSRAREARIAG